MMEFLKKLGEIVYFNNSLLSYGISLLTFFAGYIAIKILKYFVLSRLSKLAAKTAFRYDDVIIKSIKRNIVPLLYFILIYICLSRLNLSNTPQLLLRGFVLFMSVFFVIRSALTIVVFGLNNYWVKGDEDASRKSATSAIATMLKILFWIIGLLIILDNMGIKISAFIAGLGVGGVAIAFAAQAVLSDIFSYFSIFFDRPFELGDFVVTGDLAGTVEHIGVKTTRVRSLSGEQLVIIQRRPHQFTSAQLQADAGEASGIQPGSDI